MRALALKYRPHTFADVEEQVAIKAILTDQIDTKTFKHAYLFCGPAGCGKTTAARIFANDLNDGKGNPIELDAASRNGVDDVREIIDNAKRKSLDSEFKIYIIDECHMLSMGAWNAMLKLLEEPPMSTIFIMCTTDPQKIPATILSRVQRYDFSKISLPGIMDRLKYIIMKENEDIIISSCGSQDAVNDIEWAKQEGIDVIDYEEEALEYIAKMAEGGMRDAITMMDKCLSLSLDLTLDTVVQALGTVNYDVHFELMYMMSVGNPHGAISVVAETYNSGKDIKQFIKQFQYFILDVLKFKLFNSFQYVSIPNINEYETKMSDEDYDTLLKVLDWARQLNADIKWESNAKAFIETSVILFCNKEKGE